MRVDSVCDVNVGLPRRLKGRTRTATLILQLSAGFLAIVANDFDSLELELINFFLSQRTFHFLSSLSRFFKFYLRRFRQESRTNFREYASVDT